MTYIDNKDAKLDMAKLKKISILFIVLLALYHIVAFSLITFSSTFNLMSYYTMPPRYFGMFDSNRLPVLYGDKWSFYILKTHRSTELRDLADKGKIGISSIITSYQSDEYTLKQKMIYKKRLLKLAELVLQSGIDMRLCEYKSYSSLKILEMHEDLDNANKALLFKYIPKKYLDDCIERKASENKDIAS